MYWKGIVSRIPAAELKSVKRKVRALLKLFSGLIIIFFEIYTLFVNFRPENF